MTSQSESCPYHSGIQKEVVGLKKTLFGDDGRSGLVRDVDANSTFRRWIIAVFAFVAAPGWALLLMKILGH